MCCEGLELVEWGWGHVTWGSDGMQQVVVGRSQGLEARQWVEAGHSGRRSPTTPPVQMPSQPKPWTASFPHLAPQYSWLNPSSPPVLRSWLSDSASVVGPREAGYLDDRAPSPCLSPYCCGPRQLTPSTLLQQWTQPWRFTASTGGMARGRSIGRGEWEEWKLEPNKTLHTTLVVGRLCTETFAQVVAPICHDVDQSSDPPGHIHNPPV